MTLPGAHGHPDWNRSVPRADKVFFNQTVTNVDAQTDHNLGFVGDTPFISLSFEPSINHMRVQLRFHTTAALGAPIRSYTFDVRNGTNVNQAVPVLASYLVMRVTPSAVDSEFVATVQDSPVGGRVFGESSAGNVLAEITNTSIGAGLTGTIAAGNIWPGAAVWSVQTAAATWTAELRMRDYLGVDTVIDRMTNTAIERWRSIFLPARQMRIAVTNNTGAAANFSFYLNAHASMLDL